MGARFCILLMLLLLLESQRKVMKNRKTKVKEKNANFRHHRHAGKWWVATKRRWRRMLHSDFCDSNLPLWLPTLSYLSCSTGSLGIRCRVLFFLVLVFCAWSRTLLPLLPNYSHFHPVNCPSWHDEIHQCHRCSISGGISGERRPFDLICNFFHLAGYFSVYSGRLHFLFGTQEIIL